MTAPSPGGVSTGRGAATRVLARLADIRAGLEDLYRDLHRHPELSHQERRTAALVAERLRALDVETHEAVGGTGVVGLLRHGEGPTVLLRADMDGLPVREASGLGYASNETGTDQAGQEVPVMHACGHDVHVACLLGAAELLARGRDDWSGTVMLVFQPAEEVGDGARAMVEGGLARLVGPVSVALAQHVLPGPAGTVATREGPAFAAADSLRITVFGRGSHGSMPQASVDPVVLAAMIVIRLQTIVAREARPGEPVVLTVGSVRAGTKSNVIPDHATLQLNLRTYDDATRTRVLAAVTRIVDAECQASGSPQPATYELFDQFPLTTNDPRATARIAAAFAEQFGDAAGPLPLMMGSEDFTDLPRALGAPSCYWGIGGTDPAAYDAARRAGRIDQDIPVNHAPNFAPVIQPTLDTGVRAMVTAALAWLAQPAADESAG